MAKDLVAKKKTTGGASKRRKRSHKGGVLMSSGKKVPSRADLGRKHARRGQQLNVHRARGFQHGLGYYHVDESWRTFGRFGRWMFHDDEEQIMEESSEEERQLIPQPQKQKKGTVKDPIV